MAMKRGPNATQYKAKIWSTSNLTAEGVYNTSQAGGRV
jgi:hypothetical protein